MQKQSRQLPKPSSHPNICSVGCGGDALFQGTSQMRAVAEAEAEPELTPTVVHADCMSFLQDLEPESVDLIVTDPAYSGMNRHLKLGHGRIVGRYSKPDNTQWFPEFEDDPKAFGEFLGECNRVLRKDRHLYIMFDTFSLLTLGAIVREYFGVKGVIVWDKMSMGMGNYFRRQHEFILFAAKGQRSLNRHDITDVWSIRRLHRKAYPTQKPVALFAKMIEASAAPGSLVCDPFAGSGAAAIAALGSGCRFIGCDSSSDAVELARSRIDRFCADGVDTLEPRGPGLALLKGGASYKLQKRPRAHLHA
jgi:site-specific DNA-methyltransferase (adenine-specific)